MKIKLGKHLWLTTENAASSYGIPVVIFYGESYALTESAAPAMPENPEIAGNWAEFLWLAGGYLKQGIAADVRKGRRIRQIVKPYMSYTPVTE